MPERPQEAATRDAVAVEEGEVASPCRERCEIERARFPEAVVRQPDVIDVEPRPSALDDAPDLLAGSIVGDDELEPVVALVLECPQDEVERVGALVRREDHADKGGAAGGVRV